MRKFLGMLIALLALNAGAAPENQPSAARDREKLEAAVDRALTFLQRVQHDEGAWSYNGNRSPALTALGVMAFLSAGHVPGEGPHGATVEKGIRYVLEQQAPSGLIAAEDRFQMYHHGICTLMLAEVTGMTEGKLGAEVRHGLEKAVDVIIKAQRVTGKGQGGWGYTPAGDMDYADVSIVGWQLMALRAAKNVGCDVPPEPIEDAVKYVRGCSDPDSGGFFYHPFNHRLTAAVAGTGILSLEICGKNLHRCKEGLAAGEYLLKNPPIWGERRFFYGVYYCTQGSFQLGEDYYGKYRPLLHKELFSHQARDGSWHGGQGEDQTYGPVYGTSMSVMALTVEYRFLPIYQSGEDRRREEKK